MILHNAWWLGVSWSAILWSSTRDQARYQDMWGSAMRGKQLAIMAGVALLVVVGYDQYRKRQG